MMSLSSISSKVFLSAALTSAVRIYSAADDRIEDPT
jgi:hypothetical protein